jgi:predicted N-formylglutamate amidohydrolase
MILVTAEHGGNAVPAGHAEMFRGADDLLASHRGWDPGTADLARALAEEFDAPCFVAQVTRLLVDLNRSPGHPRVFSEFTRALSPAERTRLLESYHTPHRARVEATVAREIAEGAPVLHLAIHSFTPVLSGEERRADLALLYDPRRPAEAELARGWIRALRERLPGWRVRRNYPYLGKADGLTTTLRRRFPDPAYLGIEIEVNQGSITAAGRFPDEVGAALVETLPEP